jgi:hypothetical protein
LVVDTIPNPTKKALRLRFKVHIFPALVAIMITVTVQFITVTALPKSCTAFAFIPYDLLFYCTCCKVGFEPSQ